MHYFKNSIMIVFNILCYWLRVSPWPIHGNKWTLFFCLLVCPSPDNPLICVIHFVFCRMPHFLISNRPYKGSNLRSSWGTRHGCYIYLKIVSKIECNNAFSIMHWIINNSLLIISDLFINFGRNPIEILILGKAIKYVN